MYQQRLLISKYTAAGAERLTEYEHYFNTVDSLEKEAVDNKESVQTNSDNNRCVIIVDEEIYNIPAISSGYLNSSC